MRLVVYGSFIRAPEAAPHMTIWVLRLVWATLPVTAGPAAADALHDWSAPPRTAAVVLLWAAWTAGLVAMLAPRPIGLTVLRVAAPVFFVLSVIVAIAGAASVVECAAAMLATLVACGLVATPTVSIATANGVAYGDERRYPLKTPPVLLLGPAPLASLLVGAGIATGLLLLADGRWVLGVPALAVGLPLAALLARSLHGLSRRWVVLVPAGVVIADPVTLPDPVLFTRERIVSLRSVPPGERPASGALDLRLGATEGSLAMVLDRPPEFLQVRRGLRGSVASNTTEVRFAALRSHELLAVAAERRIRLG